MSGRRRLALVAIAAGVALGGLLLLRGTRVGPPAPAHRETEPAAASESPAAARPAIAGAVRAPAPAAAPSSPAAPDAAAVALTPVGAARALEAIGKNEQTRRLFERLQPVGLSREQLNRVLLILGTQAQHPAPEGPTLQALRAAGRSRALSDQEAQRVRDERQQIDQRTLRLLRPALAAVLTPAQLAQAELGDNDSAGSGTSR